MTLSPERVAGYLERLGLSHPAPELAELVSAHLRSVPFENLDIWRGVPLSLDLDHLYDKVVGRRRGGFCYELNGLFAALLEALGYRVARYSARVISAGDGRVGPPFDHLALGVTAPGGGEQLVDVGFGEGPRRPMPLSAGAELDDLAGRWRLVDAGGELRLELAETRSAFEVGTGYVIDPTPRRLDEFAAMCEHHQRSPDSPFTRGPRCTLATARGRITATETSLIDWDGERRDKTEITAFEAVLRERFGVALAAAAE